MNPRPTLGVFGGAFDPPHTGHVLLPGYLRSIGALDRVCVAPCADHPLGKQMHPFADRLAWCRAAMSVWGPWVEVSDVERELAQTQPGPSYTLRLLEAIAERRPDMRVRLVVGSDIVATGQTSRWHRWDEIERRFAPIVVPRAGYTDGPCPLPEVSSTQIREWLAVPQAPATTASEDAAAKLAMAVPASVLRMIRPVGAPVWIIGGGHVAAHLAPWLRTRGFAVSVVGARRLVDGGPLPEGPVGLVWIAVRDPAIVDVAEALTPRLSAGVPVVHAAGSRRAQDVLGPLADAGHSIGSIHPAASMRQGHVRPSILEGAAFGIEGDATVWTIARAIVGDAPTIALDGLDASARVAYHAACALLANHLAVPALEAEAVWAGLGASPQVRAGFVASLLRSAAENLLELGVPAGISGPATRGDLAGIAAHRDALPDDAGALYDVLGKRLLALLQRAKQGAAG
jgi:nicotinate (nicotinamide) nucleotide adenylyltransferase